MSGTSVIVRVRPLNQREKATTANASCLDLLDAQTLLYTGREAPTNNSFRFDAVLGQQTTQAQAFEARGIREGHCQGKNKAYAGQTYSNRPRCPPPLLALLPVMKRHHSFPVALQGLKDTVRAVLAGYNGTILAYGQTVGTFVAGGCCVAHLANSS